MTLFSDKKHHPAITPATVELYLAQSENVE